MKIKKPNRGTSSEVTINSTASNIFGLKVQLTQLKSTLRAEGLSADQIADLHKDFSHLYFVKNLSHPDSSAWINSALHDAEVLQQTARKLHDMLTVHMDEKRPIFSPYLHEFMDMEFLHYMDIKSKVDNRLELPNWATWRHKLAGDLATVQLLSLAVQKKLLADTQTEFPRTPRTTAEFVLTVQQLLLKYKPAGRSGRAWSSVIADIMRIYVLDLDVTEDKIKGILRKHKKKT